jgi:beta-lactamase class A
MKNCIVLILVLLIFCTAFTQTTDKKLAVQIDTLIKNHKGSIGVYIHHLNKNKIVAFNADTVFPTASIVKVPIMLGIINKIEHNELTYHQSFTYKDSLYYAGVDILGSYKNNEKIDLSKILMLMLTTSDNTASLWLQGIAGTGTTINSLMDSLGYPNTKVNSRTPGREAIRNQYGWGQTTPKEIASIFTKIYQQKIISPTASQRMLRMLSRQYWDGEAISALPPHINYFTKNGAVDASRSEIILINTPNGDIVISIFTKNNTDKSWETNNEAWVLTRKITNLVYNYYNPKNKFALPSKEELQKWY